MTNAFDKLARRRFLTALGLGGAALALPGAAGWASSARAGGSDDNDEDDQANDQSPDPGTTPSYPDPFGP